MRIDELKGYTLPLSEDGESSLVQAPPWYFGGHVVEIAFRVEPAVFRRLLPEPLAPSPHGYLAAVSIVDMTSVADAETAYLRPERSQFHECLIKMYCTFEGVAGWYVPATWVDKDFSLMRGFLMGFGKKLAQISVTRLHPLNRAIGGVQAGAKISAICEAFGQARIAARFCYERRESEDMYAGAGMYLMRHYPTPDGSGVAVRELVAIEARDAVKDAIWSGRGEVEIEQSRFDAVTRLQPLEVISARVFDEGFTLLGTKVIHRYDSPKR
ncbi:MAG TPA: acetoacetate decarboxylase family protein [Polyangiales bacterium]|nr:acetoacetate decarboxylase family protein [Polyangiales bacterium]